MTAYNREIWRICMSEGCDRATRHHALCWRCMMQLLSYLQMKGTPVPGFAKDRELLRRECHRACGGLP